MKHTLLILAFAFGISLSAQTIDSIINDTVMYRYYNDGSSDTMSILKMDSIAFGFINDTVWVSNSPCNGLTSITYNGYTYDLIEIGNQCWFKENLRTLKYNSGSSIPLPTSNGAGAYAWYDDDSISNSNTFGALYTGDAIDSGLCPTGWHVTTIYDWQNLSNYLNANGYNYDGSSSGNKFAKAISDTIGWLPYSGSYVGVPSSNDYPSFINKSGLSLRPGGRGTINHSYPWSGNQQVDYDNIGYVCDYWTSTQGSLSGCANALYNITVWYNLSNVSLIKTACKDELRSVRCIKD